MDFNNLVVNGVPIIAVIIGLVAFVKAMGVKGTVPLRATSAGLGLLLGVGAQISENGVPADFAGWFGLAVYGLGLGVVASGLVDAASDAVRRGNGG